MSEPHPAAEGQGFTKWHITPKQIVAGVIVVLALVFILQNTRKGHFSLLWFDFEAPVWMWLVIVFAAGAVTGVLVDRNRQRKKAATG